MASGEALDLLVAAAAPVLTEQEWGRLGQFDGTRAAWSALGERVAAHSPSERGDDAAAALQIAVLVRLQDWRDGGVDDAFFARRVREMVAEGRLAGSKSDVSSCLAGATADTDADAAPGVEQSADTVAKGSAIAAGTAGGGEGADADADTDADTDANPGADAGADAEAEAASGVGAGADGALSAPSDADLNAAASAGAPEAGRLPKGWLATYDEEHQTFYYHNPTTVGARAYAFPPLQWPTWRSPGPCLTPKIVRVYRPGSGPRTQTRRQRQRSAKRRSPSKLERTPTGQPLRMNGRER